MAETCFSFLACSFHPQTDTCKKKSHKYFLYPILFFIFSVYYFFSFWKQQPCSGFLSGFHLVFAKSRKSVNEKVTTMGLRRRGAGRPVRTCFLSLRCLLPGGGSHLLRTPRSVARPERKWKQWPESAAPISPFGSTDHTVLASARSCKEGGAKQMLKERWVWNKIVAHALFFPWTPVWFKRA